MKTSIRSLIIIALISGMLMTACIPEFLSNRKQSEGSIAATAAAQTLEALKTQAWVGTLQAELTRVAEAQPRDTQSIPFATQIPGEATFTPGASTGSQVPPTATQVPPTATTVPPTGTAAAASSTPVPCNWAYFITDVTIPDGEEIEAGTSFTKTWRLKNIGSCTWNTGYDLIFVSGNAMSSPATVDFPGKVEPGESIDLSIKLTAPEDEGEYKGNWKLRSDNGVVFGLGSNQDKPFWVSVVVTSEVVEIDPNKPINFAVSYKSATWLTSEDAKPSNTDDYDDGSVYTTDKPKLEKNYIDDELALIMIPTAGDDGIIIGRYPAVNVKDGDRLMAVIGCTSDMPKCDVTFEINYRIGDGSSKNLGSWDEVYDGKWTTLDIDLSSMAGKSVRFVLRVLSNGSNTNDRVFWLMPRIVRK